MEPKAEQNQPHRTQSEGGEDHPRAQAEDPTRDVKEIGGPKGLEPTRYGDWERKGRCIDF